MDQVKFISHNGTRILRIANPNGADKDTIQYYRRDQTDGWSEPENPL